jgi:hypothetical protein
MDTQESDERDAALREHPHLAAKLQALKQPIAEHVTDEFLARHPDWLIRYGDGRACLRGIEDACFTQTSWASPPPCSLACRGYTR